MTLKDLLTEQSARLSASGSDNAAFEAKELLGLTLGTDPRSPSFTLSLSKEADPDTAHTFREYCDRRASGEPLQYILGRWEFYGLTFKVGRGVLIPRQDTETLIGLAEKLYKNSDSITAIDLCAGTGCIGLTLEKRLKDLRLSLVEKFDEAMSYLRENHKLHGSSAALIQADVLSPEAPALLEKADLIICNPPYLTDRDMESLQREVTHEPPTALSGGPDGLEFYRTVTRLWKSRLNPGGRFIYEIGQGQEDEVMQILIQQGFTQVRCKPDACGIYRCVTAVLAE